MGSWMAGWGRRKLVMGAVLALLAATLAFVSSPAAHAGPGEDCGGADTPPARQLASGQRCDASLDEPETSVGPVPQGYTVHRYEDAFTYNRTDADLVQVESGLPVCVATNPPAGSFIADGSGLGTLAVSGQRSEDTEPGIHGPCPNQPGDYWVRITVTANDRPTATPGQVTTSGQPGDTYTFQVSGNDPDGNLKSLGVRWGDSANYDWKSQPLPSSSWSTEFSYRLYSDTSVRFYARDSYGAVSPASASFTIDVGQNDCGLGRDAAVEQVALPLHCTGWLDGAADTDSFTFTPTPGRRPHARGTVAVLAGYRLTLTSPSGATFMTSDQGDPDLYGNSEAGTWRADLVGDGDAMGYVLDIDEVDAPSAPVLSVSVESEAVQGEWFPIAMTAVDPNGESIQYRIDWPDGSSSIWPVEGRGASGQTVTGYRRFMSLTPSQWTATVTATNSDGLSDSRQITVTVVPHDDCGLGQPSYDAPAGHAGAVALPSPCSGRLGYHLPTWDDSFDDRDTFRSPVTCTALDRCLVRVTLTTPPGLAASVTLDDGVSPQTASCGYGGCTVTATSTLPSLPGLGAPWVSVGWAGGKGTYNVSVTRVPIVGVL